MMANIKKTGLALRDMGFAVHWLVPGEKRPVEAGWADAPIKTVAELEQSYREGFNVGFRPGKWSVVDGYEIVVLDIDIRGGADFADEAYAVACSALGGAFDPQVKSGSGWGRHQYLRMARGKSPEIAATTLRESDVWTIDGKICSPGTGGGRPAYVIELLSSGKNCVLPPSIHPDSHKPYEWLHKEITL